MDVIDNQVSRRKSTIWNFLFLNIGFVISIVNGILIIPLYLHYIDNNLYGAWLATGNILAWITIVDPGVSGVLMQRVSFALGKNDKRELGLAITSGIVISIVLFLVAVTLGYIFSYFVDTIANLKKIHAVDITNAFRIALWGTAFSLLADTFRNIILAYQKTKLHGTFLNGVFIAAILLNVGLLLLGYGVYALAYTSLFRGSALLLISIFFSFRLLNQDKVKLKFERVYFKSFSNIFAFTFASRLFETVATNIDLILVSRYLGPAAVTVLDISRRPVKIISGLCNSVSQSMLPSLPHLFASGDRTKIEKVTLRIWITITWISGLVIGGFILFNQSLIANWVGSKFWIGTSANIIMCVAFFLLSIGYNLSNITHSMGDMKNNSLINVVRSVVYIVFLFVLSKYFGLHGVLFAFLISILVMIAYYPNKVVKSVFSNIGTKVIIKESLVVLSIIVACICVALSYPVQLTWIPMIAFASIYLFSFVFILLMTSKFFRSDVQYLLAVARTKLDAIRFLQK